MTLQLDSIKGDGDSAWDQVDPLWRQALHLAWQAYCQGSIPIGAVVVNEVGTIVARGQNRIFSSEDHDHHPLTGTSMAHAEVSALCTLKDADHPNIRQYKLYSTMEPCPMCFSTSIIMGIKDIHYAARDSYGGGLALNHLLPYFSSKNIAISGPDQHGPHLENFLLCLQGSYEYERLAGQRNRVIEAFEVDAPQAMDLARIYYSQGTFKGAAAKGLSIDWVYNQFQKRFQLHNSLVAHLCQALGTDNLKLDPLSGGQSGAGVYLAYRENQPTTFIKVMHAPQGGAGFKDEVALLKWLKPRIKVPQVVSYSRLDDYEILVLEKIEGKTLEAWLEDLPPIKVVQAYGRFLKDLHSLDQDQCPGHIDLARRLDQAQYRVAHGLVSDHQFEEANKHLSAHHLYDKLLASRSLIGDDLTWVVGHGDYCLDNVMAVYNADTQELDLSGLIDLGRGGLQSAYQDLALALRSIDHNLDASLVAPFLEAYGLRGPQDCLNQRAVDFYILLDEFF